MSRLVSAMAAMAAIVIFSVTALAQSTVEGTVRTPSGAGIGAQVTLKTPEGATVRSMTSSGDGKFAMPAVDAGSYVLRAEAAGFFPTEYRFVLRPRQPVSLSVELQPRTTASTQVEVHSEYRTVDPEKTGSSQTLTRQALEALPEAVMETTNSLVANLMPGASQSHDNFINVRGNEFSLHEFINGVSFLDNTPPQLSPGVSPQIFDTVDLITGGFSPEYGNRFGGVLDYLTRSGRTMQNHGDLNFRGATVGNYDLNGDFGGQAGHWGYYFFADGFTSDRYLDPPEPVELHDHGSALRGTGQIDWQGVRASIKLLVMGSGADFQQPNITDDQAVGRNASRQLRQQTAILN